MEPIKLSKNVEFEVIYEDGTRKRVREGILFEAEGEHMILHNGTDRKEVLYTVPLACAEAICGAGLLKEYNVYIGRIKKGLKRASKRERRTKHEKNN